MKSAFDSFLMAEWAAKKLSGLLAYRRLSEFFKVKLPEIKLASEAEKDLLIAKLARCGTFATTHAAVSRLNGYAEFSDAQANAIVSASLSNSQVRMILGDDDVRSLVSRVIAGREDRIDPENLTALQLRIAETEGAEGDMDA